MCVRRVYVLWKTPIFHESVRLLLNHPKVLWVGAATDIETARAEIAALKSDTILIEDTTDAVASAALGIINDIPWDVRVVSISLDKNKLSLFSKAHKSVGQADDLLKLVLDDVS